MAPRSSRKQPVPEEPCGSGQSPASLPADERAQPRLLAAAAARKAGLPAPKTIAKKTGKKLLDLSTLVSPTGAKTSKQMKVAANKASSAVFTLIKAKYQKGEKKDQYSGAI